MSETDVKALSPYPGKDLPLTVVENDHPATRGHFQYLVRTASGYPVALFFWRPAADWFAAAASAAAAK